MKKTIILMFLSVCFVLSACGNTKAAVSEEEKTYGEQSSSEKESEREVINYGNMKAIWLSQFDMADVYSCNGKQRERSEYSLLVKNIIRNIKGLGFNTVIIQIRPYGDSFYPSEYYPASRFVTGSYSNGFDYDPMEVFVELAHSQKLSVQAWINPYRLMREDEIGLISSASVIKKLYVEGKLKTVEGRLYLDPSCEETRRLVSDGAFEALGKYEFDGLHIDDYFYPTTDKSFDFKEFEESGYESLDEFRINSVDLLVRELYDTVKKIDERLVFGVSPSGNLGTLKQKYYADAEKWCSSEGYIDYIMPQVYFGLEHSVCPFEDTCEKWRGIIKNGDIKLYIGMTLGKAVNGSKGIEDMYGGDGKREWIEHDDVMKRCFGYLEASSVADGISIFCYQYFYDPVSGEKNIYSLAEVGNFIGFLEDKEA